MRKDLLLQSAEAFNFKHRQRYAIENGVQRLADPIGEVGGEYVSADINFIRTDLVGDAVADYGEYDTKIESLAQLKTQGSIRSEFAMLSLARAYTRRCVQREGAWTSGIHILWWTRRQLAAASIPEVVVNDLRYATTGSLERQHEIAKWTLLMFRIVFISDIGSHAALRQDQVGALASMAESAAEETQTPSLRKLLKWVKQKGLPLIDDVLPEARYRQISGMLIRPDR
jgi:hypothetical protein